MKASELRIGNLLQKSNGQIFTVSRLDNTNDVQVLEERGLLTLGYNLLGIPLTEEWLFKFGFELKEDEFQDQLLDTLMFNKNKVVDVEFSDKHGKLYWHENYSSIYHTDIVYVHQLQNLYFALTGEELTIKDDVGN